MIKRKTIDWIKTGRNLQLLRNDNINLRRTVCGELNRNKGECSGDCENCRFEMDKSISRVELAKTFAVSESVIFNWESGKTPVSIEDILLYCSVCRVPPEEILVFED